MNDPHDDPSPSTSDASGKASCLSILNLSAPEADIRAYTEPGAHVVSVFLPVDEPLACPPPDERRSGVALRADPTRLPFASAAFDAVLCLDVLGQVLDDLAALDEMARVLRPGGQLVLRVLQESPVAWLDAHNLFRYIQSTAGGGNHPRNCGEHGWRRHYRRSDVRELLSGQFCLRRLEGRGLGLAEPFDLALHLACRWRVSRDDLYCRARPPFRALTRLDDRIAGGRLGFRLLVVAERCGP